jgi:hypothetical protein
MNGMEAASLVHMRLTNKSMDSFTDKTDRAPAGFCLWCDQDFYTSDEISVHNGDGAEACPIFKEFLNEQSVALGPTRRRARKARVNEKS